MLTQLQIGYLAGLLDGEGQISIIKAARNDRRTPRLRRYELRVEVRITQRRRLLLDTVLSWIGREHGTVASTGLDKRYFVLRFKAPWLRAHLGTISRHLILKRRQAEVVQIFLNHRPHVGRLGVGEDEWAKRDALHAEVKALNADRSNGSS